MNPLVTKVHSQEKRWGAEFAALRTLCLATGLNETLKWGQACYDLDGGNVVLIHGFKDYCALLFMKGALLPDHGVSPPGIAGPGPRRLSLAWPQAAGGRTRPSSRSTASNRWSASSGLVT